MAWKKCRITLQIAAILGGGLGCAAEQTSYTAPESEVSKTPPAVVPMPASEPEADTALAPPPPPSPSPPAPALTPAAKKDQTAATRRARRPGRQGQPLRFGMKPSSIPLGGNVAADRPAPMPLERPLTESAPGGDFAGRDARINHFTHTSEDNLSTFAIDVDTAAYSIARRTLNSNRMPTPSLVRVEEFINYFKYDYEPPAKAGELFSIQADGVRSPVDDSKHLFRVGIQAKVVRNQERLPANVVFLVDTSCSMKSEDKLPLAKRAIHVAVDQLGENDRVALTTYAGGVKLVLPPTNASNKRVIRRAIDGLFNRGGTAMSDGMTLAYQQAASMLRDGAVTRVIVFSDGDANIGATSHSEILRRIQGYVKEGVFLTTVGFGHGNYKDAMMEQLANKGNGNYYYIDSDRMAQRVFSRDFCEDASGCGPRCEDPGGVRQRGGVRLPLGRI